MLDIKINPDGIITRIAAGGGVDHVALDIAAAVACIHASLHSANSGAAEQFRDMLLFALADSFVWNVDEVTKRLSGVTCIVNEHERGGGKGESHESDGGV